MLHILTIALVDFVEMKPSHRKNVPSSALVVVVADMATDKLFGQNFRTRILRRDEFSFLIQQCIQVDLERGHEYGKVLAN